jgi:biotin transport system substrate-specific component
LNEATDGINSFKLAMTGLFTALLIVSAFIRIPLPVIPFTAQTLAVLVAPMIIGPLYGFAVTVLYFILGLFLPIYAGGGGPGYYLTPSFGFLLGFMASAFPVGLISRRGGYPALIAAGITGSVIIYIFGCLYFWFLMNRIQHKEITLLKSLLLTVVPFIPTGAVKIALAVLIAGRLRKILPKLGQFYG